MWSWLAGKKNISDWVTRGKNPTELSQDSEWFSWPSFMRRSVEEWGLKSGNIHQENLPGEKKSMSSNATEVKLEMINYNNFSSYRKLQRVVARVINVIRRKSLKAVVEALTPELMESAEKAI